MYVYPTLTELKQACAASRLACLHAAKRSCGRGFFRSRGTEATFANAKGDKLNDGGTFYWDGTLKDLHYLVEFGRQTWPEFHTLYLEGGYDYGRTLQEFTDWSYDALVNDWAIKVWSLEDPPSCECDNTHKANNTVCRWCWARGRRHWTDPEVK